MFLCVTVGSIQVSSHAQPSYEAAQGQGRLSRPPVTWGGPALVPKPCLPSYPPGWETGKVRLPSFSLSVWVANSILWRCL